MALIAMAGALAQAAPIFQAVTVSGGTVQSNGAFSLGFEFSLDNTSRITSLGFFDGGAPGLTTAHEISIFACPDTLCATGTEVVHGVVPQSGGTLINGFVYQTLSVPITLPGGSYVISGLNHNEAYTYITTTDTGATLTLAPGVHYVQSRFVFSGASTTVAFPVNTDTSLNVPFGFFAPNFQFEDAPEPASVVFILGGAGLMALLRKRMTRPGTPRN